ncbi:MAG: threonine dehydratase [Deltaproteobacteria bacterium]|nr:threonine dehydratase [Deltaproteobacteria bacterium]
MPIVRRYLPRTPLYRYATLSARLGFDCWVKHENHLPIGAFKVRGGVNLFANLSDRARAQGVITATRGNHGQSIAWAARAFGSRAVIYVPEGNNPEKNSAMQALGAEIVVFGRDFDAAREEAEAGVERLGLRYVHVANEPLLIAGVGTFGVEIVEDLPDVDVIIVPMGSGAGASGLVLALRAMRPDAQIVGVQAERAPALANSLRAHAITTCPSADTVADGLATRTAYELTFSILDGALSDVVLVSEQEIRDGIRLALETTHNVAEGAAGAAYAAAYKLRSRFAGQRVVVVHTGQNIDRDTLRWVLLDFSA